MKKKNKVKKRISWSFQRRRAYLLAAFCSTLYRIFSVKDSFWTVFQVKDFSHTYLYSLTPLAFLICHNTQQLFLQILPSCTSEFWIGQSQSHIQIFLPFNIFLNWCVCDRLTLGESGANNLFSIVGCFFVTDVACLWCARFFPNSIVFIN